MTTKNTLIASFLLVLVFALSACKSTKKEQPQPVYDEFSTNQNAEGDILEIQLTAGPAYNHPIMAIWLEDTNRNFIQTLYVSESIAKGVFEHGKAEQGHWMPGEIQRPSALPVWSHQHVREKNEYGHFLPTPKDPVVDALTGATPQRSFILKTRTNTSILAPVRLILEINQAFDFNEHWTNAKFTGDKEYEKSGQPAIIYSALIEPDKQSEQYNLKPLGHAHFSGAHGEINQDISTLTSAKKIISSATVTLKR